MIITKYRHINTANRRLYSKPEHNTFPGHNKRVDGKPASSISISGFGRVDPILLWQLNEHLWDRTDTGMIIQHIYVTYILQAPYSFSPLCRSHNLSCLIIFIVSYLASLVGIGGMSRGVTLFRIYTLAKHYIDRSQWTCMVAWMDNTMLN